MKMQYYKTPSGKDLKGVVYHAKLKKSVGFYAIPYDGIWPVFGCPRFC